MWPNGDTNMPAHVIHKKRYFTRCRSGCGDVDHYRHTPGEKAIRVAHHRDDRDEHCVGQPRARDRQFMWGAMQPVFGALADQYAASRVMVFGALMLAMGRVLTTFSHLEITLIATMSVLTAAGAAAGLAGDG